MNEADLLPRVLTIIYTTMDGSYTSAHEFFSPHQTWTKAVINALEVVRAFARINPGAVIAAELRDWQPLQPVSPPIHPMISTVKVYQPREWQIGNQKK